MEEQQLYLKTYPTEGFEKHLQDSDRIFFSGIYGLGKTTFLKNRFNRKTGDLNDKYIAFHLFPVNYSVASTKDIFELIKYDLLYQLITYFSIEELSENETIYKNSLVGYMSENCHELFYNFLISIPKIGASIQTIKENFDALVKSYDAYREKNKSSWENIESFVDEFTMEKGSIYENDFYTQLITGLVEKLKSKHSGKKVVLIIDDLDRVDPHHIFRILNIFSAHVDYDYLNDTYSNKFAIDKIVVVGDYYNIKSIFHHIYGKETEFRGYIDKFYSNSLYELSFEDNLYDILIPHLLKQRSPKQKNLLELLIFSLSVLFENKNFNLRQLKKLQSYTRQNDIRKFDDVLSLLSFLYNGDIYHLKGALENCNNLKAFNDEYQYLAVEFLQFVLGKCHENRSNRIECETTSEPEKKCTYSLEGYVNNEIAFRVERVGTDMYVKISPEDITNVTVEDFWNVLIDSLD